MRELWVCTKNEKKLNEIKGFFNSDSISFFSLANVPHIAEPQETGKTFDSNALIKAVYLAKLINKPVLADDSGLMIKELDNFPGVLTKRWADPITDDYIKNQMIIDKCKNIKNRTAVSTCALAFVDLIQNITKQFYVSVEGLINLEQIKIPNAFGYDPIFYVPVKRKTFAEMTINEKKEFSARGQALKLFFKWFLANY